MNIGVIGSGSIGPDLAYGFLSSLVKGGGGRLVLVDVKQEALDAGMERIRGYAGKGLQRGKISPKLARKMQDAIHPTRAIGDLSACDYVLEAATENLDIKRSILAEVEDVVHRDCLIGFATSGIPRAQIAAEAEHPERCFVNHPFYPAWRSLPVEVVLSGHEELDARMLRTLWKLGKVPIVTKDVPCFAADDIFCNYTSEAARIFEEGLATPEQVDAIVNGAIGGGGPFNVLDLTRGNLLTAHCQELMRDAAGGGPWFSPPAILQRQGNDPWHDRSTAADPSHDEFQKRRVLDRILAVLFARTFHVVDAGVCDPTELNWMTRTALGFRSGLLELARETGAGRIQDMCARYAGSHPGFEVPESISSGKLVPFRRNVRVDRDGDLAVVMVYRPEVKNALDEPTMAELDDVFRELGEDEEVAGVVLTGAGGSLAGADITELAALKTPEEAWDKCRRGQAVLERIASMKKPVVAAVDGPVLGGGCEISLACHARVVGPGLMLGQPEVNLGIIPGYGGTQRLPRLVGIEVAQDLLRTGKTIGADRACEIGWALGGPTDAFIGVAKELIHRHLKGEVKLAPVNPEPLPVPEALPAVSLGHHSLAIDGILVDVLRAGLSTSLQSGFAAEANGFARCLETVDHHIGLTNFMQNGPRVPAVFLNE